MSGGQNQRVAIARMLAKRTTLLFCDEPTSALDSANGRLVAELLREAAKQQNAMVLCMSHDERLISCCDRLVEIEDGQLISDTVVMP
ncbi:MAG: ATP-binding cassette domain-containing protein [Hyphomonadaceae bacterium]